MPFYKRQDDELLCAPTFVAAPDYELTAANRAEYDYPVDGWYWFDTLDDALIGLPKQTTVGVVSIRQACRALDQMGLLDDLESAIANAPRWVQIDWSKCQEVRRDWPAIPLIQPALGLSDEQIDDLFSLATTL